jgi:hypothetical protein
VIELAGGESLYNLAEGYTHRTEVLQRRNEELVRFVATEGQGSAEAASAVGEVGITILAVLQSGTST